MQLLICLIDYSHEVLRVFLYSTTMYRIKCLSALMMRLTHLGYWINYKDLE